MSFQGEIEAACPAGCPPFTTPVWTFVHGGTSPELREQAKARECNLLLCPACGAAFVPEASWIYYEPALELLAFVFPESFKAEEERWRSKMSEDFALMRGALESEFPVNHEPEVFFGPDGLAQLLEFEDWRGEEREVMEHYAREIGLSLYPVSAAWARENGAPSLLPYKGKKPSRASVAEGIKALLAANDRLTAWADFLAVFEADPAVDLPPGPQAAR